MLCAANSRLRIGPRKRRCVYESQSSGRVVGNSETGRARCCDTATFPTTRIGIDSASTATITNTTFARNEGFGAPAGISNGGTLRLNSVTFAENTTTPGGGTLLSETGATTILENTILARTNDGHGDLVPDCRGPVTSRGHNFIGDPTGCNINLQLSDQVGDPGLDAFQDNGQPGNGHFPLLPSSRAIDTGAVPCPRRDQIGQRRINECDTGAIAFHDIDDIVANGPGGVSR